jgi:hypothetical protein
MAKSRVATAQHLQQTMSEYLRIAPSTEVIHLLSVMIRELNVRAYWAECAVARRPTPPKQNGQKK